MTTATRKRVDVSISDQWRELLLLRMLELQGWKIEVTSRDGTVVVRGTYVTDDGVVTAETRNTTLIGADLEFFTAAADARRAATIRRAAA
jgi:predicted Zn-dependent protease